MPHTSEIMAPPGQPNIQDSFLNLARRERLVVTIRMMDGQEFQARIRNFDRFALVIEHDGADQMLFKHAIASIRSPRVAARDLPQG